MSAVPCLLRPDGRPFTMADLDAPMQPASAERMVMHVMRAAQQGDLPLYTWTLGLPQPQLLALLAVLYPELAPLQGISDASYRLLHAQVPPRQHRLAARLLECAAPHPDRLHLGAMARALAMACAGEDELWQDAGLSSPQALQELLRVRFPGVPLGGQPVDKPWLWRWLEAIPMNVPAGGSPVSHDASRGEPHDAANTAVAQPASPPIGLQGQLSMTVQGELLGGARQVALLEAIASTGSITHAAKAVGVSYKGAWDSIDHMNQLAGEPLLERSSGGKGGGGTRLTQRGQQLVENFRQIEAEHQKFLALLSQQAAGMADDYLLMRKMAMKTSARNQFAGTVRSIHTGAVNDEVVIAIGGGHELVAIVTHDSVVSLGLQVGGPAIALVKSSSVLLATEVESVRFSARNRLSGRISRVHPGAVNTEVVLDLGEGRSIAAIITQGSADALELAEGQTATALFKASSVIVAVPV